MNSMSKIIFAIGAALLVAVTPLRADGPWNPGGSGGGAPSGPAGGYLSGTFPNPVVNKVVGTATNDNATTGDVGEYVIGTRTSGSALTLTTNTAVNVTSISLGAGDWDVWGTAYFTGDPGTAISSLIASVTTVNGGLDATPGRINTMPYAAVTLNAFATNPSANVLPLRFSLSATTTIYLNAQSGFTSGAESVFGIIQARRRR